MHADLAVGLRQRVVEAGLDADGAASRFLQASRLTSMCDARLAELLAVVPDRALRGDAVHRVNVGIAVAVHEVFQAVDDLGQILDALDHQDRADLHRCRRRS